MRKEINFGQGRTLVFEDCGPNQFVINMLADYKGGPPTDRLTGRAVMSSTCLTGFAMMDILRSAVEDWYAEWYEADEERMNLSSADSAVPKEGPHSALEERLANLEERMATLATGLGNAEEANLQEFAELRSIIGVAHTGPLAPIAGPLGPDAIASTFKKDVEKNLRWYRIIFKGDQVIDAMIVRASRPECRDLEDGMHTCIRQAASLRLAVKIAEFERQFNGCKWAK